MRRRVVAALGLALAVAPPGATAAPARDPLGPGALTQVPLRAGTAVVARVPPGAVLAGVTWAAGAPEVAVRRHGPAGWTPWEPLEADLAVEPGTPEAGRARPGTEPVWLAPGTDLLEVRLTGPAQAPRLDLVADPGPRPAATGDTTGDTADPATVRQPRLGEVVTRAGWGADESLRRGRPRHAGVRAAVLHHTVTPNGYSAREAASYVRSVYAYHTRSRGYDDIGYNLLVDRFGTVYEGRAGGFDRGVVGAHTAGFNGGTLGVALLGNAESERVAAAARERVVGVTAWAAERWRLDPRATVTLTSTGSSGHPRGSRVTVRRLAGHRDLRATACPGRHAYAALPGVRRDAWRSLAAVFSAVRLTGVPIRPPRPATISARLDHAAAWTVTLSGGHGMVELRSSGTGTAPRLVWDGTLPSGLPAPPGEYAFTMTADDGVHGPSDPVSGTVTVALPV